MDINDFHISPSLTNSESLDVVDQVVEHDALFTSLWRGGLTYAGGCGRTYDVHQLRKRAAITVIHVVSLVAQHNTIFINNVP